MFPSLQYDCLQRCCLNRVLGYFYVRNNDFAKAAEAFKEVTACPIQLQPNDVMMASYVFEQAGDKEAAEKNSSGQFKISHVNSRQTR